MVNRHGSGTVEEVTAMPTLSPAELDAVVDAARTARSRSYAPYSKFGMGAAVLSETGVIVPGALIESISLGLAMCAERVAAFTAVASGISPLRAVALVSRRTAGELTTPCGACLQVLAEHAGHGFVIVCEDLRHTRQVWTLDQLAPRLPMPRRT
jgi:cytidine deaminase